MASLTIGSPHSDPKRKAANQQLSQRMQKCWDHELDWDLFPQKVKEVYD